VGQTLADRAATVVFTIGNDRPAVILARLGAVDFVAALRAVLVHPQAAVRAERRTLAVAVTVAPDFRQRAGLFDERVVGRNAAILAEAHDLAVMVVERLGVGHARTTITEGQEEPAVVGLDDAAAEMLATADFRRLPEDRRELFQPSGVIGKAGRGQSRRIAAAQRRRFGVAEINHPVAGKVAVGHDIEQAALTGDFDGRQAIHRGANLAVGGNHAKPAGPFADQHLPVADEGQRPRMLESAGDNFGAWWPGSVCCRERQSAQEQEQGGDQPLAKFQHFNFGQYFRLTVGISPRSCRVRTGP
jgi:hypothetical protein